MVNEKQGTPKKTLEIQVGGGVLHLGNPDGRGEGQRSLEIQIGGGPKVLLSMGEGDFFWKNYNSF